MKTLNWILTTAVVLAALVGGLGAGMDAIKVRGCKPGISPKSNETASKGSNRLERRLDRPAVAAVRG